MTLVAERAPVTRGKTRGAAAPWLARPPDINAIEQVCAGLLGQADDHPVVLKSLRGLFSIDCDVVADVRDGGAPADAVASLQPDAVVVELILISRSDDAGIAEAARAAGAVSA